MWALNRMKMKSRVQTTPVNFITGTNTSSNNTLYNQRPHMVVPYTKVLSERLKNVCNKHRIHVCFRGGNSIKSLLMAPKDKGPITKKSVVIYRYKRDMVECDEEYIGKSSRTFEERLKDHLKAPFLIHDHYNITGHATTIENFSIVGREHQNLMRTIKEALCIRFNNPFLNKNIDKYFLPHIWEEVLFNTSEFKLKQNPPSSGYSICHLWQ